MNKRFIKTVIMLVIIPVFIWAQSQTLVILHTNDIHASFIPREAFWIKQNPKPMIGGFKELQFVIDSIRSVYKNTMLFDAGDVMTGNPITEYVYDGAEGGALFHMMNMLGYDAWTVGNHEFDISVNNLKKITAITKFPTLSANIKDSSDLFPINNREYIIIKRGDLRIGVIGLMSKEFYGLVNKNSSRNIKLLPPIETAQRIVNSLKREVDILIAITHQGVEDDSVLAVSVPEIDVIIGGHSHTRLQKPKKVNNTIIAQAGSNCEYLGQLKLVIENGKIANYEGKLIPLWIHSKRPTTELGNFIDSIHQKIEEDFSHILGVLKNPWIRARGESNIGNFITDAQREAANADVAFMNDHGIRQDVPAGNISKRKLFEVLPFRNVLGIFTLTGKQLKQILEYYIKEKPAIQTSGLIVEYIKKGSAIEFKKFLVNGKPLVENAQYTVAASDYFIGESQRYLGMEISDYKLTDITVLSVVEQKILKLKSIDSKVENRIKQVKD